MPIDYSKSKIYRIVCNETGEQYFGSTTQTLAQRLSKHRDHTNNSTSKQIIQRGNYDIVLCEEFPCENKEQLHARERKWIEENECINNRIPARTLLEKHEYEKKWREENREKVREIQKNYRNKKK
jgi:hypothetical protein